MTQHEDHIAKELFKIYKISLVNYCIRKFKSSKEDSEEFVSETFLRLTEKIEQVAYSSPAEQRSWLFSTLTHIVSEHYRKNKYISKKGFESLYNVYIMDETHTILGVGASAVTKLKNPKGFEISRIFNFKYPYEYISRYDELIERKKGITEFYESFGNWLERILKIC